MYLTETNFEIEYLICSKDNPEGLEKIFLNLFQEISIEDGILLILPENSEQHISKKTLEKQSKYIGLRIIYQFPKGSTTALDLGVRNSSANWICWLNDDCFPVDDKGWIVSLQKYIEENPEKKLFGFVENRNDVKGYNLERYCAFGCIEREYYFKHYEQGNPYRRYFWDMEIYDLAKEDGVFLQTDIEFNHSWNKERFYGSTHAIEKKQYQRRRIKRLYPNNVSEKFCENEELLKFIDENIFQGFPGGQTEIIKDKEGFLIIKKQKEKIC